MRYIILLLLMLVLAASLANSPLFVSQSLTAYFLFITVVSIILICTGMAVLTKGNLISIFSYPSLFFFLWCIYIAGNTISLNNTESYRWNLLVIYCLLYFSITHSISSNGLSIKHIYSLISIFALTESVICILQYLEIIGSFNDYFKVTGTWNNPNVTAMFLAMAVIPACGFIVSNNEKRIIKYVILAFIGLIITGLVLLQCRTALVGTGIAMLIVLNFRYDLVNKLFRRSKIIIKIIALLFILIIGFPLGSKIFTIKQDSSQGRVLIWKVSLNMVADKPIFGFGYGRFEREYNLYQANYFERGKANLSEIENSGHVRMAYNELMENSVEGGIIGMFLFAGVVGSLIASGWKSLKVHSKENLPVSLSPEGFEISIAFTGVFVFALMSVVNFTVQAIPVMALFILYAAALNSSVPASMISFNNKKPVITNPIAKWVKLTLGIIFILLGSGFLISNLNCALAQLQNKDAQTYMQQGKTTEALETFRNLGDRLSTSESFHMNYGRTLMKVRSFGDALVQFTEASKYTSDPDLYMNIGHCNRMLGKIQQAGLNYKTAMYIQPSLFAPRFALMQTYKYLNDTTRSVKMAKEILVLRPKVQSKKVSFYKLQAEKYLQRLQHLNSKRQ